MKMSKVVVVAICITIMGCSTPFKKPTSSINVNPATASKVTVQSVSNSSLRRSIGKDFSESKVSINGEFIGDFSQSEKSFSYEVNPGPLSMDFCLEGYIPRCLSHKIQVDPNNHYFFEYELVGTYLVIGSGANRQIRLKQVAAYGNPQTPINPAVSQQPQQPIQKPTPVNQGATGLESAKKKCIDLGFKLGTESFGNCVLKVAN
jgi:hypothetical protein